MIKEYVKIDGKVFEVVGKDAQGRNVVAFVPGLKEIPNGKPVEEVKKPEAEETKPVTRRKRKA